MQGTLKSWVIEETLEADLGDKRLNKRLGNLLELLSDNPNKSIPAACNGWSETIAAYRFFDNESVSPENILFSHKKSTINRIQQEPVVLIVQDTSEINYSHREPMEGMGYLSHEYQQGFYLHPSIAVTPNRVCLGVVDNYMWSRDELGKRFKHKKKAIEEKESYRWILGYEVSNTIAREAPNTLVVNVADREGDIYELLMKSPEENEARWLVRSTQNRQLVKDKEQRDSLADKLWEKAKKAKKVGEIEFYMPATETRKARKVKQVVRSRRVYLRAPKRKGCLLPVVGINIVFCTEINGCRGEEKIEWLLLTSVEIHNEERALDIIKWYLCRWQIEIFFKILKSGCEIEKLQFESFARTANCITVYMIVAWRILYLTMLGRYNPKVNSALVFDEKEWKSVYAIFYKKKPPKKAPSLNLMMDMIARLGGYLGRKHDAEPGPQSIWLGMQRMKDFAIAWEVFSGLTI